MLNIAIQRILFKGNLSISRSFLIAILVIGSTSGMISITNDAMGQPFKGLRYNDHLFRVSDSETLAIPPDDPGCPEGFVEAPNPELGCIANTIASEPNSDSSDDRVSDSREAVAIPPNGECPEGTTQASPPLNPQLGCIPNNETSEPSSKDNFIIKVTVVDDLDDNISFYDLVDIYVKEYPQYGHFDIDLTDALYSDTSDGEYTIEIIMPSGLIEADEEFEICIEGPVSGGENGIICEDLTNNPQQQPEEVTITV